MKFVPIVCALLMSGCAVQTGANMTFHGDVSFNDSYRSCIEDSCNVWRGQTGYAADVVVKWDYDPTNLTNSLENAYSNKFTRLISTEGEGLAIESKYYPFTILGHTKCSTESMSCGPIVVSLLVDNIGADKDQCMLTVMHELGHGFGLHHADSELHEMFWKKTDIMYPNVDRSRTVCLKQDDIQQFCFLHDCPMPTYPCDSQPDSVFLK